MLECVRGHRADHSGLAEKAVGVWLRGGLMYPACPLVSPESWCLLATATGQREAIQSLVEGSLCVYVYVCAYIYMYMYIYARDLYFYGILLE